MYMIVFVTLIVAVIGTCVQVLTKQSAKGYAQQAGIAQAFMAWHTNATDLAGSLIKSNNFATGCSLTNTNLSFQPYTSLCIANGGGTAYVGMAQGGFTMCNETNPAPCWTGLPSGYNSTNYQFYSVAFASGGKNWLLTYIPSPPSSSDSYGLGLLCLPGSLSGMSATACSSPYQLTISFNQFYQQLRLNMSATPLSYGIVTASGTLTTPTITFGSAAAQALSYTIPSSTQIPVGSLGLITQITPCPTC